MSTAATLNRKAHSNRRRIPRLTIVDRIIDWIFPPKGPERGPVKLSQSRIYIVPTNAGLLFAMTLILLLIGSINYNLSLGYGLTFLLTGTAIVSMLHTWRNLAQLQLAPGKSEPVFAGDRARFTVLAINSSRIRRCSMRIQFSDRKSSYFDVEPAKEFGVRMRLPALQRGVFRPGRFRIFTTYPLGLFYAWANVELEMGCLVYPAPEPDSAPMPESKATSGTGSALGMGDEDFAGLRAYHPGDSPRRIAWKAVARTGVFSTKLFSGSASTNRWMDLADTPQSLGIEQRLSRLTRWILDSNSSGLQYGLRLPDQEITMGAGDNHKARCLEALALYGLTDNR